MTKYNFNIESDDFEIGISKSVPKIVSQKDSYLANQFVDMGLPSGTLWGKYNLGVDLEKLNDASNWIGNYYAWGEIKPRRVFKTYSQPYNIAYYKFHAVSTKTDSLYTHHFIVDDEFSKYCNGKSMSRKIESHRIDGLKILELKDDAAYKTLSKLYDNPKIHMPNFENSLELIRYTKKIITYDYCDIKGLNGVLLESITNNNSIFFPFTGYKEDLNLYNDKFGYMWTSSISTNSDVTAGALCVKNVPGYEYEYVDLKRFYGLPIRPIINDDKTYY